MIDVPEVTQSPATLTAVIRFQIPGKRSGT